MKSILKLIVSFLEFLFKSKVEKNALTQKSIFSRWYISRNREGGDIGLLITLVPKVLQPRYLIR